MLLQYSELYYIIVKFLDLENKIVIPELVQEWYEQLGLVGMKYVFVGGKKGFITKILRNLIKNL